MTTRLADRLHLERHRRFVGRIAERELFQTMLETGVPVLHVYGPGGVGKTTLLKEFAYQAAQAQRQALYLDAHNLEATPESFLQALARSMELGGQSPLEQLNAEPGRHVILIDTYEALVPLDDWLRDTFLPQLPEHSLVVFAGRNPPTAHWRTDSGWQGLIEVVSLRNLSPEESRTFLTQRLVPTAQHRAVLEFTHGHPLALSLVADVFAQRQDTDFRPDTEPNVVKTLLENFIDQVPSLDCRRALEVCVLVHLTTEGLLAEMLAIPDARPLFEWLRGLSFVESGPFGLFPHDLAREVLSADLRWRNRDRYIELHARARTYYSNQLQQTAGVAQQGVLFDYIYLHRDNPIVRPCFEWQRSRLLTDSARAGDWPLLLEMVERFEGSASARLAEHWFTRQPHSVLVFRDHAQQPVGFLMLVALHEASAADIEADPATAIAWQYLQAQAPLRAGEGATYFRFWMAAETYHSVSPVQSLILTSTIRHYLMTPGLAFSFLPCRRPEHWARMFAYADIQRIEAVDFTVGDERYGVYGHDWRTVPPTAWLALLAQREISQAPQTTPVQKPPLVVLSAQDFTTAIRTALRDYARPDQLKHNPLVRSRLVAERLTTENLDPVAILQSQIQEAAALLQASPRDRKAYRALHYTYLEPLATQEAVAEQLDLPFSTFRRHLTTAVNRLREILWQRELQQGS